MINQHAKLEDLEDKAEDMRSAPRRPEPRAPRGVRAPRGETGAPRVETWVLLGPALLVGGRGGAATCPP